MRPYAMAFASLCLLAACGSSGQVSLPEADSGRESAIAPVTGDGADDVARADTGNNLASADSGDDLASTDTGNDLARADSGDDGTTDLSRDGTTAESGDVNACFPLFRGCANSSECCAPYRCLNITGTLQCQDEGPVRQDSGMDTGISPDASAADAGCAIGCHRQAQSTYCAPPAAEWVCSGSYDMTTLNGACGPMLATGAIRYCCPADFKRQCP